MHRFLLYVGTLMLVLSLPVPPSQAQRLQFHTYSVEHGLPQSVVRTILQDSKGYMWFGTLGGGISKFDGLYFRNYNTTAGLVDNAVQSLMEDSSGRIWIGTAKGLSRYDGQVFTTVLDHMGQPFSMVRVLLEDSRGNFWVGSAEGLSRFDGHSWTRFTKTDGLVNNSVYAMAEEPDGTLWIGTSRGISEYDGRSFTSYTVQSGLINSKVWTLLYDSQGMLWIGTEGGLSVYDGKRFINYTKRDGLGANSVRTLLIDDQDNLWGGTMGGGIFKYDGNQFVNYSKAHGLSNDAVIALYQDLERNIWIGTHYGGVSRFRNSSIFTYSVDHGLAHNDVRAIQEDHTGNLWFGTNGGGISRYDGNHFVNYTERDGLPENSVQALMVDDNNNIWVGTNSSGVSRFDGNRFTTYTTRDGLADNRVSALFQDRQGYYWFGTRGGGICRYDGERFVTYTTEQGLAHNWIQVIREDAVGNLWIGTLGGGLSRFDGERFVTYDHRNGLVNNWIRDLFIEPGGDIWCATLGGGSRLRGNVFTNFTSVQGFSINDWRTVLRDGLFLYFGTMHGVNRLEPETNEVKIITTTYGLDANGINIQADFKDSHGNLWFGTGNGVIKISPAQLKPNILPPPIYITGISVTGKDTTLMNGLEFAPDTRTVSFRYVGLCFTSPEEVRYRYRLQGLDDTWIETTNRTANFSRLPPSQYLFEVEAKNNDGLWSSAPAQLTFTVTPPYWATWQFRMIISLLGCSLILGGHRMRTSMFKRRNRVLEGAVQDRTKEIATQMERVANANALLEEARDELERIVKDRTHELLHSVEDLSAEITERKKIEKTLQEYQKKLQSLASELTLTEERERRSIAAGLHDLIVQNLTSIRRNMELWQRSEHSLPRRQSPQELLKLLDQVIQDTRSLSLELSPPELYDFGLEAAVEGLVEQIREQHEMVVLFDDDGEPKPMEEDLRVLLFTATREILVNVTKHAQAHTVHVSIVHQHPNISICVSDDGVGFDVQATNHHVSKLGGFGLFSIRERLSSLGGHIMIESSPGAGTRVSLIAPLKCEAVDLPKEQL